MTKPTGKQVWEWTANAAATRPQMAAAMARSIKIQTDIATTGRSADLDNVRARIEAKIKAARQRLRKGQRVPSGPMRRLGAVLALLALLSACAPTCEPKFADYVMFADAKFACGL